MEIDFEKDLERNYSLTGEQVEVIGIVALKLLVRMVNREDKMEGDENTISDLASIVGWCESAEPIE